MQISQFIGDCITRIIFILLIVIACPSLAEEVNIGTGSRAGIYYQVGRAICRLMNANKDQHGLSCEVLSTKGSLYNLRNIRMRKLQLGIAQSDWQYHAVHGSSKFQSMGSDPELRALFSVHSEPFTLVARQDAGINSFDDLKGKRVNIGNPGSGQRGTMEVLMEAKGWDKSIFSMANELAASEQSMALCHNRVQAMIYTVGHPNTSVTQAVDLCDAIIVAVEGEAIDKLVKDNPYYAHVVVPGGIYQGNSKPINTFGVKATVVASSKLDTDTVYTIVKTVFEHLDDFKKIHPAFRPLEPAKMITDGISAPFHEGAIRYYREKNWLK